MAYKRITYTTPRNIALKSHDERIKLTIRLKRLPKLIKIYKIGG